MKNILMGLILLVSISANASKLVHDCTVSKLHDDREFDTALEEDDGENGDYIEVLIEESPLQVLVGGHMGLGFDDVNKSQEGEKEIYAFAKTKAGKARYQVEIFYQDVSDGQGLRLKFGRLVKLTRNGEALIADLFCSKNIFENLPQ